LLGIINKRKKDIIKSNDNYDKFTARFEFATKTKPTNRIKSETEIALERKNELERLEKERLKGKIDKDDELFGELINEEDKTENIGEVGERNQTKRERIQKLLQKRLENTMKNAENEKKKETFIEKKRKRKKKMKMKKAT